MGQGVGGDKRGDFFEIKRREKYEFQYWMNKKKKKL